MATQTDLDQQRTIDLQQLADFIHELNITRRHLSTYPPGHPTIDKSFEKLSGLLDPLFTAHASISLGVSKDALLFKQQWLAKGNPNLREFANTLARLDIAAVHFRGKPGKTELFNFVNLINSDRQSVQENGGITELLQQQQLTQIEITPVDYAAFQTTELDPQEQERLAESIWENFITGLLDNSLFHKQQQPLNLNDLDPQALAKLLNQHYSLDMGGATTEHAIEKFIKQLRLLGQKGQAAGLKFHQLIEQLNPELRRRFLNSTFRELADSPTDPEEILQALPAALVDLALQELNQEQLDVSAKMLNLLGELSRHNKQLQGQLTSGKADEFDSISEELKTIFREEDKDKFTPASYQATLELIVQHDHQFRLDSTETIRLRQSLLNSATERNTCAVIFNLLSNENLQPEQYLGIQNNLIDLAQFFLETGDFKGLGYLHRRLGHYQKQYPQTAAEHTGLLQERLNAAEFHQEVLDNLSRWNELKQKEIAAYIKIAGSAIASSLIERLAKENDKSLRRIFLTSLASLGKAAHPAIYSSLNHKSWFLVRNLLAALRMQNDPIELKKLTPLEKHPHLRVNQELMLLLFKVDRKRADELLGKQLKSNDSERRLHAVQLAELSRNPIIVKELLKLLTTETLTDSSLPMKRRLIKSLNGIGSEEALPTLEALLKPGFLFTSKRKLELQMEIIRNLHNYPGPKVTPLLEKQLKSRKKQLRNLAAEKLRQVLRKQA